MREKKLVEARQRMINEQFSIVIQIIKRILVILIPPKVQIRHLGR